MVHKGGGFLSQRCAVSIAVLYIFFQVTACQTPVASESGSSAEPIDSPVTAAANNTATAELPASEDTPIADAETIIARRQVPILCYHRIREWKASDSKAAKDYIVPVQDFKNQMKMLADSGYHTVLPDQLYLYLTKGTPLPPKPIMLTFDDTVLEQFTIAKPEMEKYGFKGVFFIMTVSIGRPGYMSREQIKALSDAGHTIGSHTWDHHNFKKYQGEDWVTQIEKPTKTLEEITGKPIEYFAYPFGLWNAEGIPELKKRGFTAAFQLAEKRDSQEPLYTIRRIIPSGYWSTKTLHNSIVKSF